jgi:hypothetical protein
MADGDVPRPTLAIIATFIWGALTLPGLVGAALSVMFFDAPGSMNNPIAWLNALIVISFPCLCILSIAGSWIVWRGRKRRPSRFSSYVQIGVASLPLIPVTYVVAALVVETAGVILSGQPLGLHSTIIHPLPPGPSPRPHRP